MTKKARTDKQRLKPIINREIFYLTSTYEGPTAKFTFTQKISKKAYDAAIAMDAAEAEGR